jgi:hypothetical protein
MPIVDSPYTDPDTIQGLYDDPENEILLAEMLLQTGAGQAAYQAATLQAASNTGLSQDPIGVIDTADQEGQGRGPRESNRSGAGDLPIT